MPQHAVEKASDGLKYGIALAYHQLLLDIARQNNDHKELVEHARVLWLSRLGNEYYDLMASAVPREKWPAFRTRLLSDKACPRDLAAWAYARDGLWSEVRDIVLATPSLLPPYQLEMCIRDRVGERQTGDNDGHDIEPAQQRRATDEVEHGKEQGRVGPGQPGEEGHDFAPAHGFVVTGEGEVTLQAGALGQQRRWEPRPRGCLLYTSRCV